MALGTEIIFVGSWSLPAGIGRFNGHIALLVDSHCILKSLWNHAVSKHDTYSLSIRDQAEKLGGTASFLKHADFIMEYSPK